jgi:predicted nucleic acid-binding protein
MDERRGRKIACTAGLRVVGLLGVLVEAKDHGLIRFDDPIL